MMANSLKIKKRPTKRAPDAGDSAHIPSSFTRLFIFLAGRLRRPRPSAGNANRWALNTVRNMLQKITFLTIVFSAFLISCIFQETHSFLKSNLISSLMFVVLHIPGWFFMGSLISNMTRLDGAVSIFLIGLLCGYAVNRGNSVLGGVIVHFLNNLV